MTLKPMLVSAVCVSVILSVVIFWYQSTNHHPQKLWLYNLKKGELFIGTSSDIIRSQLKPDSEVALAEVIRINGDPIPVIVFLQKTTSAYQAEKVSNSMARVQNANTALVAALPLKPGDSPAWVSVNSEQGIAITNSAELIAHGRPFVQALP